MIYFPSCQPVSRKAENMEPRARISLLVIPNADGETSDLHILLDRKTVIASLARIPAAQLSRIVRAVYTRQENATAEARD